MKKLIAIALSAAVLALGLVGCGGKESSKAYNLNDIVTAVESANPIANPRDVDDNFITLDMLLTKDNIEEYAGKVSNDQADSALIVAVKAVEGKGDAVKAEMETYKTSISTGGLYSEFADKEAAAKDARIVQQGDYVVMVVANTNGADYSAIDTALDEALK
ncbi:DUF4358 domain-containing protein [Gemmiger sp. An50]|uniref:DUF4358 domain-containing protein n=1 Tax=Gemmiger sp. An50 TaxID=1965639 RepID=UPI000B3AF285|nr:DUF4358 domain-containing protein [Gemmiger sp. An50]OUN83582.1 hypothetical protein B5G03_14415 [Gemmiger sp. An50]